MEQSGLPCGDRFPVRLDARRPPDPTEVVAQKAAGDIEGALRNKLVDGILAPQHLLEFQQL